MSINSLNQNLTTKINDETFHGAIPQHLTLPQKTVLNSSQETEIDQRAIKTVITPNGIIIKSISHEDAIPEIVKLWGRQNLRHSEPETKSRQQEKRAKTRKKIKNNFNSAHKKKSKRTTEKTSQPALREYDKKIPYYDINSDIKATPLTPLAGDAPHNLTSLLLHSIASKLSNTGEALLNAYQITPTANPNKSYSHAQWMKVLNKEKKEVSQKPITKHADSAKSPQTDNQYVTHSIVPQEKKASMSRAIAQHSGIVSTISSTVKLWFYGTPATKTKSPMQSTLNNDNEAIVEDEDYFDAVANSEEMSEPDIFVDAHKTQPIDTASQLVDAAGQADIESHKRVKRLTNGYKLNRHTYLKSSVVSITSTDNSNVRKCSGALIAKDKVVTCRHCVYLLERTGETSVFKHIIDKAVTVSVKFQGATYPCLEMIAHNNANQYLLLVADIVICRLAKPIPSVVPFKVLTGNELKDLLNLSIVDKAKHIQGSILPDMFTVADGGTFCDTGKPITGSHTGHTIGWFNSDFGNPQPESFLQLVKIAPIKNMGNYQNICHGDSGAPVLVFYPRTGKFILAGLMQGAFDLRPGEIANQIPAKTIFISFVDRVTAKWIEQYVSEDGPFYDSSLDPSVPQSIPFDSCQSKHYSKDCIKPKVTITLSLDYITWASSFVYAELSLKSKYSGAFFTRCCQAFTNFPCEIVIQNEESFSSFKVKYKNKEWRYTATEMNSNNIEMSVSCDRLGKNCQLSRKFALIT